MPRRQRIVVPEQPHHVIQRGNRRQKVFFYPGDKILYLKLLKEQVDKYNVEVWAYCLLDNHVHLVLVPKTQEGLAKAVAETNRRFTCKINARYDWRGYLWQGRFISFVMDENYLVNTLRYVENNPVRAGIVENAWDYLWSSARNHVKGTIDPLLSYCPATTLIGDWKEYLIKSENEGILDEIRKRNLNGLPLGEDHFLEALAEKIAIKVDDLKPKANGRPKKS
jgi:putative transposase